VLYNAVKLKYLCTHGWTQISTNIWVQSMIPIINRSGTALYEQIYQFYSKAILDGSLKVDHRMPPHRVLANELGVGINTVLRAYEQLVLEGYVRNEHRRGLFVNAVKRFDMSRREVKNDVPSPKTTRKKSKFSASVHMVDQDHFPIAHWRKCTNVAMDAMSYQYPEYEAEDPLKGQLVKYLYENRGVRASESRIVIGSGATALLFWLAFLMKKKFSGVAIEEPAYPRPRAVFAQLGYSVTPVKVSSDGIDVDALIQAKSDVVYVTPSHQYPTGTAIPIANRLKLLNWARRKGAYIIEDDFDCEFRHRTRLMPSLQGLDKNDKVIYLGSFSNSLMPSLRVGYLVVPENFPVPYQPLLYLANTVPSYVRQTLALFMEKGYWDRHLRKMRTLYKRKYDLCMHALSRIPAGHVTFQPNPSGLNILLRIVTKLGEDELIKRAADHGIQVTAAGPFYYDKRNQAGRREVLFEFGSLPEDKIEPVIDELFRVWFP
jgi:GntR family transcriptional regulator / MocR family aminotransferase